LTNVINHTIPSFFNELSNELSVSPLALAIIMPTRSTFSFGGGKEVAEFMAARGQVIANIEEVYEKAERYGTELSHSTAYRYVGIDCQRLKLDEDGKHLNLPGESFFSDLEVLHGLLPFVLPTPKARKI
jgi:hypothetical protein